MDARNIRSIVLMRPINSMIEFKQVIGRGIRLYEGKNYFAIYDFVQAHHHFSDPEWDGEPIEPESPEQGPQKSKMAKEPRNMYGPSPEPEKQKKIKVKLSDGKAHTIQHMMCTSFRHPDRTPMSAQQFMEVMFGKLPEFFEDEAKLRSLWSAPDPRGSRLSRQTDLGSLRDFFQLQEKQCPTPQIERGLFVGRYEPTDILRGKFPVEVIDLHP